MSASDEAVLRPVGEQLEREGARRRAREQAARRLADFTEEDILVEAVDGGFRGRPSRQARERELREDILGAAGEDFFADDVRIEETGTGELTGRISAQAQRREIREDVLEQAGEDFTAEDVVIEETPEGRRGRISRQARERELREDVLAKAGEGFTAEDVRFVEGEMGQLEARIGQAAIEREREAAAAEARESVRQDLLEELDSQVTAEDIDVEAVDGGFRASVDRQAIQQPVDVEATAQPEIDSERLGLLPELSIEEREAAIREFVSEEIAEPGEEITFVGFEESGPDAGEIDVILFDEEAREARNLDFEPSLGQIPVEQLREADTGGETFIQSVEATQEAAIAEERQRLRQQAAEQIGGGFEAEDITIRETEGGLQPTVTDETRRRVLRERVAAEREFIEPEEVDIAEVGGELRASITPLELREAEIQRQAVGTEGEVGFAPEDIQLTEPRLPESIGRFDVDADRRFSEEEFQRLQNAFASGDDISQAEFEAARALTPSRRTSEAETTAVLSSVLEFDVAGDVSREDVRTLTESVLTGEELAQRREIAADIIGRRPELTRSDIEFETSPFGVEATISEAAQQRLQERRLESAREQVREDVLEQAGEDFTAEDVLIEETESGLTAGITEAAQRRELREDVLAEAGEGFTPEDVVFSTVDGQLQAQISEEAIAEVTEQRAAEQREQFGQRVAGELEGIFGPRIAERTPRFAGDVTEEIEEAFTEGDITAEERESLIEQAETTGDVGRVDVITPGEELLIREVERDGETVLEAGFSREFVEELENRRIFPPGEEGEFTRLAELQARPSRQQQFGTFTPIGAQREAAAAGIAGVEPSDIELDFVGTAEGVEVTPGLTDEAIREQEAAIGRQREAVAAEIPGVTAEGVRIVQPEGELPGVDIEPRAQVELTERGRIQAAAAAAEGIDAADLQIGTEGDVVFTEQARQQRIEAQARELAAGIPGVDREDIELSREVTARGVETEFELAEGVTVERQRPQTRAQELFEPIAEETQTVISEIRGRQRARTGGERPLEPIIEATPTVAETRAAARRAREARIAEVGAAEAVFAEEGVEPFLTAEQRERIEQARIVERGAAEAVQFERFEGPREGLTPIDQRRRLRQISEAQAAEIEPLIVETPRDLRELSAIQEAAITRESRRDEGEQFGDIPIVIPEAVPAIGGERVEDVLGEAADTFRSEIVSPVATTAGEATRPAGDVLETAGLIGEETLAGATEGLIRGGGDILASPVTVPVAVKEGVEFGAAGVEAQLSGRGGEFGRRATEAAEETGAALLEQAEARPALFTGRLAGGLVVSAGAIGAASRVSPVAGRAVSTTIQPGEELAIAAARRGVVSRRAATTVPGVRSGMIPETGGGINLRSRVPSIRELTPDIERVPDVTLRRAPDEGLVSVDPLLTLQARRGVRQAGRRIGEAARVDVGGIGRRIGEGIGEGVTTARRSAVVEGEIRLRQARRAISRDRDVGLLDRAGRRVGERIAAVDVDEIARRIGEGVGEGVTTARRSAAVEGEIRLRQARRAGERIADVDIDEIGRRIGEDIADVATTASQSALVESAIATRRVNIAGARVGETIADVAQADITSRVTQPVRLLGQRATIETAIVGRQAQQAGRRFGEAIADVDLGDAGARLGEAAAIDIDQIGRRIGEGVGEAAISARRSAVVEGEIRLRQAQQAGARIGEAVERIARFDPGEFTVDIGPIRPARLETKDITDVDLEGDVLFGFRPEPGGGAPGAGGAQALVLRRPERVADPEASTIAVLRPEPTVEEVPDAGPRADVGGVEPTTPPEGGRDLFTGFEPGGVREPFDFEPLGQESVFDIRALSERRPSLPRSGFAVPELGAAVAPQLMLETVGVLERDQPIADVTTPEIEDPPEILTDTDRPRRRSEFGRPLADVATPEIEDPPSILTETDRRRRTPEFGRPLADITPPEIDRPVGPVTETIRRRRGPEFGGPEVITEPTFPEFEFEQQRRTEQRVEPGEAPREEPSTRPAEAEAFDVPIEVAFEPVEARQEAMIESRVEPGVERGRGFLRELPDPIERGPEAGLGEAFERTFLSPVASEEFVLEETVVDFEIPEP